MSRDIVTRLLGVAIFAMLATGGEVEAHEAGTVEVVLDPYEQLLRVEMDLLDLDYVVGVRRAGDDRITGADLRNRQPAISNYVLDRLEVSECVFARDNVQLGVRQSARPRAIVEFDAACGEDMDALTISSRIFEELPDYRTVLRSPAIDGDRLIIVNNGETVIPLGGDKGFAQFMSFGIEGVHHILIGIDHLVFLLLLILPLSSRGTFQQRFLAVLGLVTAFTIAHSVTLVLSTLGHLSLPPGPVEVVIAASILIVAAINLFGRVEQIAWPIAYGFGLVHGFGFAGAFRDLVSGSSIHWSDLLAFNLGVEVGQLMVVAVALLVLQGLARRAVDSQALVRGGSLVAGFVGVFWIIERL